MIYGRDVCDVINIVGMCEVDFPMLWLDHFPLQSVSVFVQTHIYLQGVSKKILLTNMVIQKDDIINIIII